MNVRDLLTFLGLQIFSIAVAGGSFALIENRLVAGGIAGGYFVISGLFMVWRSMKWKDKWHSFAVYPLFAHVFAISIPMMISRFLQAGTDFEAVRIFGLEGPEFHKLSTRLFMVLIAGTTIDLIRVWRAERATR